MEMYLPGYVRLLIYRYLALRCLVSCSVNVYSYPARSISCGKDGASTLLAQACFQFLGVNLSTMPLKASYSHVSFFLVAFIEANSLTSVHNVVSPSMCLPSGLHPGTCMILSL
jgi:hypothetical protein